MSDKTPIFNGLNDDEVAAARSEHGLNELTSEKKNNIFDSLLDIVKEPMFLLLLAAATIYFVSGQTGDGLFMVSAIVLVTAISLYQENKSRNALDALKTLTQPLAKVIRNGSTFEIPVAELVPGDLMVVEEGSLVPADGQILQAHDFSVNEAILTGESLLVSKNETSAEPQVFQGTLVAGGAATCRVTAIGNATKLGQIGKSMEAVVVTETPLQRQINHFVKMMAWVGIVVFMIVWAINYSISRNILDSLLKALTLAMSILPEEIPVAFTTFMALGAWRLMQMGIIVKQTQTVEALGSATVICTDKTGTITENRMELARLFLPESGEIVKADADSPAANELIRTAMWASEPEPFDPMETALHSAYLRTSPQDDRAGAKMVHEYPLDGQPPMMTHVFGLTDGTQIIAAKGAPEAIVAVSNLTDAQKKKIEEAVLSLQTEGFRVLGVGQVMDTPGAFPAKQQELRFSFKGLVAFYDPPKENINQVFQSFYNAGIDVKMITGDHAGTATTIAQQVGFLHADKSMSGAELMELEDGPLEKAVHDTYVFTRMFPDAKMKIIQALKKTGQIVAMTGDGVNDGPALKAAHIGVAMGKKGSEIAKQASALVLVDDDLSKMVDAVAMGRKIYVNLKKAIQYIISIHIPIILTVFVPLALGWKYPNIFFPVHIIFLEMIMGPTCSIVYENEPMEPNTMKQPPRPMTTSFFSWAELRISILQGLMITAGTLTVYQYAVGQGLSEAAARTLIFITLITANVVLTLVNRSFQYSIITTARYKNNLMFPLLGITVGLSALMLFVPPITRFFRFEQVDYLSLGVSIGIGILSVIWMEVVKWFKRR